MWRRRWQRDASQERFWRGVLRRWRGSGLAVRSFCAGERVSEASFYAWRREIALRDHDLGKAVDAAPRNGTQAVPAFVPVRVLAAAAAAMSVWLWSSRDGIVFAALRR